MVSCIHDQRQCGGEVSIQSGQAKALIIDLLLWERVFSRLLSALTWQIRTGPKPHNHTIVGHEYKRPHLTPSYLMFAYSSFELLSAFSCLWRETSCLSGVITRTPFTLTLTNAHSLIVVVHLFTWEVPQSLKRSPFTTYSHNFYLHTHKQTNKQTNKHMYKIMIWFTSHAMKRKKKKQRKT